MSDRSTGSDRRIHIAILGGGLGGLAAAYELTSHPRWFERYRITVYQKGWRLGGKGASGRGPNGRIEEHGLHCFWGFYDNAFSMLRACYGEIDRQTGPIRSLKDAFIKLSSVWFIDSTGGRYRYYEMHFPENAEEPGCGPRVTEMAVDELLARYVRGLREMLGDVAEVRERFEAALGGDLDHRLTQLASTFASLLAGVDGGLSARAHDVLDRLATTPAPPRPAADDDDAYRHWVFFQGVKFAVIVISGLLRDGMPRSLEGFSDYDDEDLRAWLKRHDADDELLASPIVTGLYNASFCYPGGDFSRGDLAAGVSLRAVLLMGLRYRGSFMWKMRASMGDTVFAPIYEALVRRGQEGDRQTGLEGSLRFEFFHRVRRLSLDADGRTIDAIDLDRQARVRGGGYAPLEELTGLPCWPAEPFYEQLVDGESYRGFDLESDFCTKPPVESITLRRGRGFDHVVLAIPVAALRTICAPLVAASSAWRDMVDRVRTIRTKSFQVWLRASDAQAAWQSAHRIMTDVYENDFNSIADMFQTLPFEAWSDEQPAGVMYFSTAMRDDPNEPSAPDDAYPKTQDDLVRDQAHAWLSKWQKGIFPWMGNAYDPSAFVGEYFRANISADQRYTLSVAGSTRYRLSPGGSGFDNLFLAGDWTKSMLDLGCAENATSSGLEAGRALLHALEAAPSRGAPSYLEYPGMPVYPPAYRQRDLTLCQFVLRADPKRMQEVVDRLLNPAAGERRFRALGAWVLFQTGHIAQNQSDPPGAAYGTGSETSATFLVPVYRSAGRASVEVGFFAPFVLVDHPLSLVAGREVLGWPKHMAAFVPNGPPSTLDDVTIDTMVVRRLGRDSPVEQLPLLRVRRAAPERLLPETVTSVVTSAIDALAAFLPIGHGRALVRRFLEALLRGRRVRFFGVRELRDLRDPTRAAFRELTCGVMHLGKIELQAFANGHTIEIVEYESHPLAAMFGLAPGLLRPTAALKLHVDEATLTGGA